MLDHQPYLNDKDFSDKKLFDPLKPIGVLTNVNYEQVKPMAMLGPSIVELQDDSFDPIIDIIKNLNHHELNDH